jgi:hypothetical protein
MSIDFTKSRAALVMSHPGHELRVYQWLRLARPLCFVLTDGSGRSGKSRLHSTTKLLEQNGAQASCIYGRLTDHRMYSAIIKGEFDLFIDLTGELTRELVREEIEYVVGDATEGYNPAHDICRYMINAAVEAANRQRGQPLLNFEVFLTRQSDNHSETIAGDMCLHLDEDSLSKKLEAARAYPEIASDVDRILNQEGLQAIQTESFRSARHYLTYDGATETPGYELHGEKQVAAGYYEQVLRYREHVLPLAEALRHYSQRDGP